MEQERLPYMCQARGCDGCTVCKGEEMELTSATRWISPDDGYCMISKTSVYSDDCPFPEAFKAQYGNLDQRCHTFEEASSWVKRDWYRPGSFGHGENATGIFRYLPDEAWFIETPKDLLQFIKDNGQCVIGYNSGFLDIEIYDDYRE